MNKFAFGLMRLPLNSEDYADIDQAQFQEMADLYMEAGGTYFDTAYPYHMGNSETAFREAVVRRYPRDRFTVTDKLPMFMIRRAEQMPEIFDEQLERCGVDFFDYYWLHALTASAYETVQKIDAFGFIEKKKKEGKIRRIGFSFHDTPEVLDKILTEHPETEFVQLQINYLDWNDPSIQAKNCYDVATAHHVPVMVMEPVKGGTLVRLPETAETLLKNLDPEMSNASWAIRFAASLENVERVLSGMSTVGQMEDNISFMKDFQPLSDKETDALMKVAEIIRENIAIPCTACRYCEEGCPKNIAIPDYFAIYNNLKSTGASQQIYYMNLTETHGKASDCVKCGQCEKVCPQHLPIRDYLEDVAKELEVEF